MSVQEVVDATHRHDPISMAFHWLTVALVCAAFVLGPGGSEERVYSTARDFDRQFHELLGLSVLVITLLRLLWRAIKPAPQLRAMPRSMHIASKAVQGLLYLLLLLVPLAGITGAWLEGHPLTVAVFGDIQSLLPKNRAVGALIVEVHTYLGDAIMWLAGLHAGAALFHHFAFRDDVLLAMVPARFKGWLRS